MPDFDAISAAIVLRYAPAQVTPPAGLTNIRSSTGDAPNQLGPLPAVIVVPVQGTFTGGASERLGEHDFLVRFYLAQAALADFSRDLPALRKWLTVLADQLKASTQLGGIVAAARVTTWKLGVMRYADADYSGIELGAHVTTSEGWAASA